MRNIKQVLRDRSTAFEEAVRITGTTSFWKEELERTDGKDGDNDDDMVCLPCAQHLPQPTYFDNSISNFVEGAGRQMG